MKDSEYLYHFTTLTSLFSILIQKKLFLTDPTKWEDENDKCSIDKYKKLKQIKTLLALCFTTERETYHLWKIYGHRDGVRITFDKAKLEKSLKACEGIRYDKVEYRTLGHIRNSYVNNLDSEKTQKLPFLKRKAAYKDENEWRAIYESFDDEKIKEVEIKDDLTIIKEIALNPWLQNEKSDFIKNSHYRPITSKY